MFLLALMTEIGVSSDPGMDPLPGLHHYNLWFARGGIRTFDAVYDFDWDGAIERIDDRVEHQELRMVAFGFIGVRLHALIYAPRGETVRVISLRRPNTREVRSL